MRPQIERVRDCPALPLDELLAESEADGLRLVRRLDDDWRTGANRFDRQGEALFAPIEDERLVGVCGLNIDPYSPSPSAGRVRHLYVLAASRNQGVGTRLVREVIDVARATFEHLRLRTSDAAAARFYERRGFRRCDNDPSATHERALL